ncbi:protein MOR1 isoform X1 [Tanacetum coccineum]
MTVTLIFAPPVNPNDIFHHQPPHTRLHRGTQPTFSIEKSVEGMKVVCLEFEAISKDPEVHLVDDLITDADRLVSCLAAKNKWLAHAVNQRTLDNLITELLLWSLDERVPRMDDGSQLLKALNVLMLKILDEGPWYELLIFPFRFELLCSIMIPISIKVSLDLVKSLYAKFIDRDKQMVDVETGTSANATK